MTNEEFFDIGRVAYITGNVQEALAAKQALELVVENANNLQQLRAEIASIALELYSEYDSDYDGFRVTKTLSLIEQLRKLSITNKE